MERLVQVSNFHKEMLLKKVPINKQTKNSSCFANSNEIIDGKRAKT